MKRLLFVFNPHSGTGKIIKNLGEVINIFTKADYEVVAYPTQSGGDGERKILSDGNRFDRIVVAGGDGMLHELVNAALQLPKQIPVGYIPTGTINDFASTHNIPKNIIDAAVIAASDNIRTIDVGMFNDEIFSYVAAFGLVTNVAYDTDQKAKNNWGVLAYLANGIKNMDLPHFYAACRKMTIDTYQETTDPA